jgi:glutaredoxin
MKKVTVLQLSGCPYCEELIEKLDKKGIPYSLIDANNNGELADEIEALLNTDIYPIILIKIYNQYTYFIFRAKTYEELGETSIKGSSKIGVTDVNAMVEAILNLTSYAI